MKVDSNRIFAFDNKLSIVFIFNQDGHFNNLAPDNMEREIRGLTEAMDEFNLPESYILTHNQKDSFIKNGKKIHVRPVWKWLTDN